MKQKWHSEREEGGIDMKCFEDEENEKRWINESPDVLRKKNQQPTREEWTLKEKPTMHIRHNR